MKVETKQSVDQDEDQPQNPKIPEDYYKVQLDDIITYEREGRDSPGLVLRFKVLEDVEIENDFDTDLSDGDVIVPFFAPAKLSYSEEAESSRLTDNLIKLGLHDAVLEEMGFRDAVMEENKRVIPESDSDVEEFVSALNGFLAGKVVKADVSYGQDGEQSQINKFSKVVDSGGADEGSQGSEKEEEDSDDVILGGDDDEAE
jgi:hypothetical protein